MAARDADSEDRARFGSFDALREASLTNMRAIVEEAAAGQAEAGSGERKVGDLYTSFMDKERVDGLGVAPCGRLSS